jgi:hypothetical protein
MVMNATVNILMACCLLLSLVWFIRKFYITMMSQSEPVRPVTTALCTPTGFPSTSDGSDCCTGTMDFNAVCQPPSMTARVSQTTACVPDGQPSLKKGRDCCSSSGLDIDKNCAPLSY